MFAELEGVDKKLRQISKALYDRTIDFGAHPNELAFTSNIRIQKGESSTKIVLLSLTDDAIQTRSCIITKAEIGICSLELFKHVFRHRYDLIGLTETLDKMKDRIKLLYA